MQSNEVQEELSRLSESIIKGYKFDMLYSKINLLLETIDEGVKRRNIPH